MGMLLAGGRSAHAAEDWTLTTSDFRTERVGLPGIDPQGLTVTGANGASRKVDFDRMLQIDRISPTRSVTAPFLLFLATGEQLAGEPKGLAGETLLWQHLALGELKIPLARVSSMARASRSIVPTGKRPTDDVIALVNGDTVRGIIAAIRDTTVAIQASGGDSIDLPLQSIAAIEFAPVAGAQTLPETGDRAFRVSMSDFTSIIAASLRLQGEQLALSLPDGVSRSIPIGLVTAIEQLNGPVVWLSSKRPIENVQTPFLELASPARMNQSVDGGPIRFGERVYSRGIGVHSYSRLVWTIDPAYRAFRTQYAIDGQLAYANVVVRIKLDERVVHEQKDMVAGTMSPLVVIDTAGAAAITLEVDYGDSYDVQDRFNWIEPALLKQRPPPPAPITPPATSASTNPATRPLG